MFRAAKLMDLEAILRAYEHARSVMRENGNPTQWGDSYPSQEQILRDINSNHLFIYMHNGILEGVFALVPGEDPTYQTIEGEWLNNLPYSAIHRVASAGHRAGVADKIIEWCGERTESLRADTHKDNRIMQHVLEKNGFVRCGIIHVEDGSPRIAYQRPKH